MKPKRYCDQGEHRYDITAPEQNDPILVRCPKCSSKALILPVELDRVKCVCTNCSFNKMASTKMRSLRWELDIPDDGYFGFDLWLQVYCCSHSLYAFTTRHLDLLETYIKADLRERQQNDKGWRNASVASRLSRWIKSGKNQEQLIKAIN